MRSLGVREIESRRTSVAWSEACQTHWGEVQPPFTSLPSVVHARCGNGDQRESLVGIMLTGTARSTAAVRSG